MWLAKMVLPLSAAATLAACSLAPVYQVPVTAAPAASYKEAAGWKPAQPADVQPRGAWWEIFHDNQLDTLQGQVTTSNQNLKAAFARLQQARAQMQYVASAGSTRRARSGE